jgi:hypothetical protein
MVRAAHSPSSTPSRQVALREQLRRLPRSADAGWLDVVESVSHVLKGAPVLLARPCRHGDGTLLVRAAIAGVGVSPLQVLAARATDPDAGLLDRLLLHAAREERPVPLHRGLPDVVADAAARAGLRSALHATILDEARLVAWMVLAPMEPVGAGRTLGYVRDREAFFTILPLADAQHRLVVNASYGQDARIIEAMTELDPDLALAPVDVDHLLAKTAGGLSPAETHLRDVADRLLSPLGIEVELRPVRPATLPVLLDLSESGRRAFARRADHEGAGRRFRGLLDDVDTAEQTRGKGRVVFNLSNELVRAVANEPDPTRQRVMLETLWLEALLLARLPLSASTMERLTACLHRLMRMSATPTPLIGEA